MATSTSWITKVGSRRISSSSLAVSPLENDNSQVGFPNFPRNALPGFATPTKCQSEGVGRIPWLRCHEDAEVVVMET